MPNFVKSFSFKFGVICFAVFLFMISLFHYMVFSDLTRQSEEGVKEIVAEEMAELDGGITKQGSDYGENLISILLASDSNNNFLVAYYDPYEKLLEGNLKEMPVYSKRGGYIHFPGYIGKMKIYLDGSSVIVAHSTKQVERTKDILGAALTRNIIFSFLAAIFCSALVTYIINYKLRSVNNACDDIIGGNLSARVEVNGHDEFAALSGNINRMLDWIDNLLENTKNTSISIAHDIKTPLSRHRITLERMAATQPELNEAITELDKITSMFDSILNLARAESGISKSHFEEVNLSALVNDIAEIYEAVAEDKSITINKELEPDIIIRGHRQFLGQAVSNLMDNAVKYAYEGGRVDIMLKKQGGIELVIKDNGPGIEPEYYDKVTEKFFRLDKSRTLPGLGLGLSLVAAIVRLHGGRLQFSDNKSGLVATINLA